MTFNVLVTTGPVIQTTFAKLDPDFPLEALRNQIISSISYECLATYSNQKVNSPKSFILRVAFDPDTVDDLGKKVILGTHISVDDSFVEAAAQVVLTKANYATDDYEDTNLHQWNVQFAKP